MKSLVRFAGKFSDFVGLAILFFAILAASDRISAS